MTYEKFIDNILKLDKSKEYAYYSGRGSYKILDVSDESVQIQVLESDGSKKTISIPKEKIESFLKELKTGKPVYPNNVTKGSGSYRAIAPSLLCLTPHIFFVDIKNNRHLIELDEEHELGEMTKTEKNKKASIHNFDHIYNRIFFGAPGTGKSHKINYDLFKDKSGNSIGKGIKEIPESRKFRTTFHPDYDYAQFVGAYKPLKKQSVKILNKNELIERLKEMKNTDNYPIHKFSAFYSESLSKLSNAEQAEIIKETATPDSMFVEMKKGIAVGEFLKGNCTASSITYSFVPQVFAKAYVSAWTQYINAGKQSIAENQVYLVIEEINRGNCAQIFGDIFQLLDRKDGYSDYPIDVDSDFASYIKEQLSNVKQSDGTIANYWDAYKSKIQEWDSLEQGEELADGDFCKIALPPNLNILATMNTSDQSLFPMDSAFKRRFDWEYIAIDYAHPNANFNIEVGDKSYKWLDFLKAVNANVYKVSKSEDKQMGEFFIKHSVDYKEFRSKVLFYLWDSIYKDEEGNKDAEKVFHFKLEGDQDKTLTFQTLFEGSEVDQKDRIAKIMSKLGVVDQNAPRPQQGEQGANDAPAESAPAEELNPAQ